MELLSPFRGNTRHLTILMAAEKSMRGERLYPRRRGKLLIFRLTPRGLRRLRLEATGSSRISVSTAS
jgi:hypothetical protein